MISFADFISRWSGQPIDFDGVYPNQCMDLMHFYVYEVLGLTDKYLLAAPSARQVFTNFKPDWGKFFDKIDNTLTNIPPKGDIIFFSSGEFGHVSIFIEGDAKNFKSFDANWPVGSLPHIQSHNYAECLGWLHPKTVGYDCEAKLSKLQLEYNNLQNNLINLKKEFEKLQTDYKTMEKKYISDLDSKQEHIESLQKTGAEMTAQLSSMQKSYQTLQDQLKANLEAHNVLQGQFKEYQSVMEPKLLLSEQFYQQSLETIRKRDLEVSELKQRITDQIKGYPWFRLLLELFIRPLSK